MALTVSRYRPFCSENENESNSALPDRHIASKEGFKNTEGIFSL